MHDYTMQKYNHVEKKPIDPFTAITDMLNPWTFGFNRHLNMLKMLEDMRTKTSYPPYNIRVLDDDKAEIEVAVAGFKKEDVTITYKDNVITVQGSKEENDDSNYSHKGIATRNFTQRFAIADDVVVNGAKLKDGLLIVYLERIVPDEKKERVITIK